MKEQVQTINKEEDINHIFKEIRKYHITREDILDFFLQGKDGDAAFFYYKSMVMQLMEKDEHLDNIIIKYIGIGNETDLKRIYTTFRYGGDGTEIKSMLQGYRIMRNIHDISEEMDIYKNVFNELVELLREWARGDFSEETRQSVIDKFSEIKLESLAEQEIQRRNDFYLSHRKRAIPDKTRVHLCPEELSEEAKKRIRESYLTINMEQVAEMILKNLKEKKTGYLWVDSPEFDLGGQDKDLEFEDDAFVMSTVVKVLLPMSQKIMENTSLESKCLTIRRLLQVLEARRNYCENIETNLRTVNIGRTKMWRIS